MVVTGPPSERYRWSPITIAQQLERTAAARGDREALVAGDRRWTWSEVRAEARSVASGLAQAGIDAGDHVAVWLPNYPEWVLTWYGAAYLGAVVIPVNSRYKTEEVRYILKDSDSKLLVMCDEFLGIDYLGMLEDLGHPNGEPPIRGLPELREIFVVGEAPAGARSFDEVRSSKAADDASLDRLAEGVDFEDPTIVVYTSGTTGNPKGAVHSHRILRNEYSITEWMDIDEDSRVLGHMPFFHVAGGFSGLLPPLITGASIVLMDHWDPTEALEIISRERITIFNGIPTHFIDLLQHPELDRYDTTSLNSGWIGGAANPPEVINGAIQVLGVKRLLPVYGMTETTSVTTFPRPDDPVEVVLTGKGVPVSDFELRVVSPDGGKELDAGVEGEVCVRGHIVMQGYYRKPEATAKVMDADGWFHTGDLGVLDEDGYLAITGRLNDMFIVGGANAYPAEIEMALCEHGAVKQAYVVGVPDSRLGEVGYAFVELREGESADEREITEFCRGRLANYKVPRYVTFVDSWPLTATGKIQKYVLRERAASLQ